jgi:hypothetical protein
VGRWLSEDPIGFGGGDANLYRYVGNASTGYVDPDGLEWAITAFGKSIGKSIGSMGITVYALGQDAVGADSRATWQTAYSWGPHGQLADQNADPWMRKTAMGANVGGICAAGGAAAAGPTAGVVGYGTTLAGGGTTTEAAAMGIVIAEKGAKIGAVVTAVSSGFEAANSQDATEALHNGVNTALRDGMVVGTFEGAIGPMLAPGSAFMQWLGRGAAADSAVGSLPMGQRFFYEIGNRTYSTSFWNSLPAELCGSSVEATVARGAYIVANHPVRALFPLRWVVDFGAGIRSTIGKGPDSMFRAVIQPFIDIFGP